MIKVTDLAYGRIGAPDLDKMEEFLLDFGMVRADRTKNALYMRGTDGDHHHLHVTELGDPVHIGMAWWAKNEEELEKVSKMPGAGDIHEMDEPGGGKRVLLTDPDGRQIEVIYGMEVSKDLEVRDVLINTGKNRLVRTELQRIAENPGRPSHVKRSAHVVVKTKNLQKFNEWYQSTLGLDRTDSINDENDANADLMTFNHIDAGQEYSDHHVLLGIQSENAEFNHLSFEVADFDDVQIGHNYLKSKGYKHAWGVGRHMLGSQIFDYWRDPWGRIHEHWTDGDVVNNSHVAQSWDAPVGLNNQWGPDFPQDFVDDPHMHVL
jgi:catechol 2,3-dioxygenase-like lactoylglutathione lyase family enzyme